MLRWNQISIHQKHSMILYFKRQAKACKVKPMVLLYHLTHRLFTWLETIQ